MSPLSGMQDVLSSKQEVLQIQSALNGSFSLLHYMTISTLIKQTMGASQQRSNSDGSNHFSLMHMCLL